MVIGVHAKLMNLGGGSVFGQPNMGWRGVEDDMQAKRSLCENIEQGV